MPLITMQKVIEYFKDESKVANMIIREGLFNNLGIFLLGFIVGFIFFISSIIGSVLYIIINQRVKRCKKQ